MSPEMSPEMSRAAGEVVGISMSPHGRRLVAMSNH
jgi:hypothetical protein